MYVFPHFLASYTPSILFVVQDRVGDVIVRKEISQRFAVNLTQLIFWVFISQICQNQKEFYQIELAW